MSGKIRIGEILIRAGAIDQHQLNAALGEQARWGRRLGVTLIKMGFIEEKGLVRALASQLSLPVASLDGKRISPDVLNLVTADLAMHNMVLPLFVKKGERRSTLYLAMEDPGNLQVLDDLAFRTGMQVKPVMMGPSELCEGIDRYYRDGDVETATPIRPHRDPAPAATGTANGGDADLVDPTCDETGSDSGGTDELIRHFTLAADPKPENDSAPTAAPKSEVVPAPPPTPDPVVVPAPPSAPEPMVVPAPPPAPVAVPEEASAPPVAAAMGSETVLDETSLAVPPPRRIPDGETVAPEIPLVESLASYDARTRTILHALTQLLIEKGVVTRDEIHDRVSALTEIEPVID